MFNTNSLIHVPQKNIMIDFLSKNEQVKYDGGIRICTAALCENVFLINLATLVQ